MLKATIDSGQQVGLSRKLQTANDDRSEDLGIERLAGKGELMTLKG